MQDRQTFVCLFNLPRAAARAGGDDVRILALLMRAQLHVLLVVCVLVIPAIAESPRRDGSVLIDDFESGSLNRWSVRASGGGGWFIYSRGSRAPDKRYTDPDVPFDVPNPPQGKFAAVTDMKDTATCILEQRLALDRPYILHLTVFYVNAIGAFANAPTLNHEGDDNQQFRIDLLDASAVVTSLSAGDVLATIFRTSPGDPGVLPPRELQVDLSPWRDRAVRLRIVAVGNLGTLRAGVDDIWLEPAAR